MLSGDFWDGGQAGIEHNQNTGLFLVFCLKILIMAWFFGIALVLAISAFTIPVVNQWIGSRIFCLDQPDHLQFFSNADFSLPTTSIGS